MDIPVRINTVYATAYGNGHFYIGGRFNIVANTWARKIAQWDGVKWSIYFRFSNDREL